MFTRPNTPPNVSLALSWKVETPETTLILSENVVIPVTLRPPLVVSTFLELSKYASTDPVSLAII